MSKFYRFVVLVNVLALALSQVNLAHAQCGPGTPVLTVDLTGNPDSVWISPSVQRNDNCCGTTAPDKCVQFIITLDPGAEGISFDIASGAVPGGALFYQINCGPQTPLGGPICLDGVGPHMLTFCKPGNNENTYMITSIPGPTAGGDIILNDGCIGSLTAVGYDSTTVTWTSIFPGTTGQYNSYLSCTSGCNTTGVQAQAGYPPFVDYVVCGVPSALCNTTLVCDTVRVTFNPTLFANITPINPTVCFGQTNTTITANGTGGTPAYNYTWSTGATTQSITVGAGTYSVIIGDVSGCPPTSANVTVTAFANPITANAGPDQTLCATSSSVSLAGSVTGTTTGIWSGGAGTFIPNNTTLNATYFPTAAEIASGTLNLTLITTNNGTCPGASDDVTISFVNFSSTITFTSTNVSCNGGGNGSATAVVTGSFAPYTYSWNTSPVQTGVTASGLTAGNYTVTVTDNVGCVGTGTVSITQPFPLSSSMQTTAVLCAGGSTGTAAVSAIGGTGAYSYSWSPSGGSASTATGLAAGTYIVTIADANGCQLTDTAIITQPLPITLTATSTNVSCAGGSNGSITANPSGGTGSFSYTWTPGSMTSQTATGLTAGTYQVTVTDANGCQQSLTTTISQPASLSLIVNKTNETCAQNNNGTASATVGGGTAPYDYLWMPGGMTTSSVTGLAAGSYTLTVTDDNGCQVLAFISITQPDPLAVSFTNNNAVTCFGGSNGSVTAQVTGGTAAYTYAWSPGGQTGVTATGLTAGTYTVNVTDANGCVATNSVTITQPAASLNAVLSTTPASCFGSTNGIITTAVTGGTPGYSYFWTPGNFVTPSVFGLGAGTYNLVVTDANGCTFNTSATITQPSQIVLTTSTINSSCSMANGQASVGVTGGSPGYTYAWSPTPGTNPILPNIQSGHYEVVVTDANGCSAVQWADVNDNAGPAASIISVTNVSCFGGSDGTAIVGHTGGTGPFTYFWSPSGGTDSIATGLSAGTYTAFVMDANGCQSQATTSPAITQPPALLLSIVKTNVSCFGGSNGTATVTASGGTPGYTYSWAPGGQTTASVNGLAAGTYTVTVTDANGCINSMNVTITQPTQLTISQTAVSNVSCFGGSNGSGTVAAAGGTTSYAYSWSPLGGNAATATGLSAGTYTATVTDAMGCTANIAVTITQPATSVFVSATTTPTSCFGGSDGTATASASGGTGTYSYVWSPTGGNLQTATNLAAGTYSVTATDANGCQSVAFAVVAQPQAILVSINTLQPTCGNPNGTAIAQVTGGISPYSYAWSSGGASAIESGLAAGSYNVVVTDAEGCTGNSGTTLTNIPGPTVSITNITHASCDGFSDGTMTGSISSGTAPYQIFWTPAGGNNLTAFNLAAGTYTMNVTDANGCTASASGTVNEPTPLSLSFSNNNPVSCFGGSDGSVTGNVSGGTSPYVYSWSPFGGSNPTATGLTAQTYTLTVVDDNGCTIQGNATITQPTALTVSIISTDQPTCFGSTDGSLVAQAGGGTPGYSYVWNTLPVQVGTTASALGIGTYTVTVTDAEGCTANASGTLIQPTPVQTFVGPGDTICLGQNYTVSASATGGSGGYYFVWDPFIGTNASYSVAPTGPTTYAVTAYDQNGCPGNTDSILVVVYNLTAANVFVEGFSPICPGVSTLIYAAVTGTQGPLTYTWTNGLGPGPGGFLVTPTAPTTYSVTVTNACGASITESVDITFNPPPTILFTSDVTDGCAPLTVNFNDMSTTVANDSILTWTWDFGDGNTLTTNDPAIGTNPSNTYTSSGVYDVTLSLVTWGGCTNNSNSNPYTIVVHPQPVADFSLSSTYLNLPYDNLSATNLSQGAISYVWDFGDGSTTTVTNPIHIYQTIGTFYVSLIATNQFGCTDTAVQAVQAVSEITFPNAFTPNPDGSNGGSYSLDDMSNDVFFPYTSGVDTYHLMIFNRWGELIFESFDLQKGWDGYYRGQPCLQDVYVWKAEVKFIDGREFNKTGDVTLLR